jgi:selenocysteine lyase/cysteine desulfurase
MLAVRIPDAVEMRPLRLRLQERHRVVVRGIPPEWFNGLRFSTHIFNTEEEVDSAVAALRAELA